MDELSRTGSLADEPAALPPMFVAPRGEGVKAGAVATGGALGFIETVIPAGHSTPLHVHRHEHEAFYVLTGAVDFVCSDRRFRAEAGAFVRTGSKMLSPSRSASTRSCKSAGWRSSARLSFDGLAPERRRSRGTTAGAGRLIERFA